MGSVRRVPAKDIELAVAKALIAEASSNVGTSNPSDITREVLERMIAKVETRRSQLAIHLKAVGGHEQGYRSIDSEDEEQLSRKSKVVLVPWNKSSIAREIIRPAPDPAHREKPTKAGPRVALIRSIGLGRYWLRKIVEESTTAAAIAADHGCGIRMVNMTISLAFLSPSIVTAAVEGKLPRGLSVRTLRDPPPEWSHQIARLGLAPAARR